MPKCVNCKVRVSGAEYELRRDGDELHPWCMSCLEIRGETESDVIDS